MSLMFVAFGLYFLYDGFIGYPKKNAQFASHASFFDDLETRKAAHMEEGGTLTDWEERTVDDYVAVEEKWKAHATAQGWPEEPPEKHYSTGDQFFFGALCIAVGLAVLGTMFINRGRSVRADEQGFYTDKSERVRFESAFRIDKRKWDNKGLAYVYHRDADGKQKRAVIDDLKYNGADKILTRLLDNFEGELIERVSNETPEASNADWKGKEDSSPLS